MRPFLVHLIGFITLLLGPPLPALAQSATPAASPPAAVSGDFAGLVDIGGDRRLWLECRGTGSPTVILESGYPNTAEVWDTIALPLDSDKTAVLPGVAEFARVCAYDRPGTILPPDRRGRSDTVTQPRTLGAVVADLHALLRAAGEPGPYVLVGHSLGGLMVRLYAATYPDEVAGLVLVDPSVEGQVARIRAVLTPEQAAAFDVLQDAATGGDPTIERYGPDGIGIEEASEEVRAAVAARPPAGTPMILIDHGVPMGVDIPPGMLPGFPWEAVDRTFTELHRELVAATPGARLVVAAESGHYIQLQQPELVIAAIRQVVDAVRDPGAWATPAATPVAASGDFTGLVDIGGGRRLWLECRGTGSPTVVLEAGGSNNADTWDAVGLQLGSEQTAVLPGVAAFTRVCAYDRPGTILDLDHRSRSDPVPMPRDASAMVADLHALLTAAAVPDPYVLAGHSFGGLIIRLYAAAYPDDVVGLVLIDAAHEDYYDHLRAVLTPEQWAAFSQPPEELASDPAFERLDVDASATAMREAAAASPLRPLPLVVLTHGRPWDWPPGFPVVELEAVWLPLQDELARLVPDSRLVAAEGSGHFIPGDQPELVIAAIQQVVDAVRDPSTWTTPAAGPAAATPD